jgi:hypothetical protein
VPYPTKSVVRYFLEYAYRTGIYLLVNNHSTAPITLNGGISLKPGAETYVGVSRTFMKKLGKPYSNCIQDLTPFSDYSKVLFGYFADFNLSQYDQDICTSFCYQDKLINNCNCCSTLTKSIRNKKYCQTFDEMKCETDFEYYFGSSDTNQICENVCRAKCMSQKFTLASSMSSFPSKSYQKIWMSFLTAFGLNVSTSNYDDSTISEWASECVVRLIVNYDEQTFTEITEAPANPFDQFLVNIGGAIEFCLEVSLLTAVELFILAVEFLIIMFYKPKERVTAWP